MFIYIPFICVTLGAVISWRGLPPRVLRVSDMIMNTALMLLMTVIGLNIGLSETVMKNLGRIGIKCLLISLAAIACSVALTALCSLGTVLVFFAIYAVVYGLTARTYYKIIS